MRHIKISIFTIDVVVIGTYILYVCALGHHDYSIWQREQGKRYVDCITKMRFFAVLAIVLYRNLTNQSLFEKGTYSDYFKHVFE